MQNFGNINNAFNEVLIDGIIKKDNDKKSLYKKYLNSLKENKILKNQYLIYKNLEEKVESDSNKAIEYVNENISLLNDFNVKDVKKYNNELISLLGENSDLLNKDYPNKKLHENISFLMLNKKTTLNIDDIIKSKNSITEHIISNEEKVEQINETTVPTSILSTFAAKKFNKKYGNLDESTKKMLKVIIESDEKKQKKFFKESLESSITCINNNLKEADITEKEKLLEVKNKLLDMSYNKETFPNEIIKINDLIKNLEG